MKPNSWISLACTLVLVFVVVYVAGKAWKRS